MTSDRDIIAHVRDKSSSGRDANMGESNSHFPPPHSKRFSHQKKQRIQETAMIGQKGVRLVQIHSQYGVLRLAEFPTRRAHHSLPGAESSGDTVDPGGSAGGKMTQSVRVERAREGSTREKPGSGTGGALMTLHAVVI